MSVSSPVLYGTVYCLFPSVALFPSVIWYCLLMEPPVGLASLCCLLMEPLFSLCYMVLSIDGASSRPRLSMSVSSPLLYGTVY